MPNTSKRTITIESLATFLEQQGINPYDAMSILSRTRIQKPEDYAPNSRNHNQGTERGNAAIDASVSSYGLHRSIAVAENREAFAGSHLLQSAIETGTASEVIEVDVTGDTLVAVKRVDIQDGDDPKAIAAGIADNLTHERNFTVNPVQLKVDIVQLESIGMPIPKVIVTPLELSEMISGAALNQGDPEDGDPGNRSGGRGEMECTCPACGHSFIRQTGKG